MWTQSTGFSDLYWRTNQMLITADRQINMKVEKEGKNNIVYIHTHIKTVLKLTRGCEWEHEEETNKSSLIGEIRRSLLMGEFVSFATCLKSVKIQKSVCFRPVSELIHIRAGNASTDNMPNYCVYTPLPAVKHNFCVVCVCVLCVFVCVCVCVCEFYQCFGRNRI